MSFLIGGFHTTGNSKCEHLRRHSVCIWDVSEIYQQWTRKKWQSIRRWWVGPCNCALFLSRRFHKPIYFKIEFHWNDTPVGVRWPFPSDVTWPRLPFFHERKGVLKFSQWRCCDIGIVRKLHASTHRFVRVFERKYHRCLSMLSNIIEACKKLGQCQLIVKETLSRYFCYFK